MLRLAWIVLLIGLMSGVSACGGAGSAVQAPPPPTALSVGSITPSIVAAGSPDLLLTITGAGFDGAGAVQSRVTWTLQGSETPLATTVTSSTQINATVPAALLKSPVTVQIAVEEYDHVEGVVDARSNPVSFSVTTPQPGPLSIGSISPMSAAAGSPDLSLTITGSGFDGAGIIQSRVTWTSQGSETPLATTVTSSTQITATIPATLLKDAVTAQIVVEGYDRIEGVVDGRSNSLPFDVTAAASNSGFASAGNMLFARSGHSATLLADGRVLVAGGDSSGVTAEIYDPATEGFTATGSMSHPRSGHRAILLNDGRVLVAGGEDSVTVIATAEIYDPAAGTFTALPDMHSPRWGHTATLLPNGTVLIAGGSDNNDSQATAEIFDPATNRFSTIANMTTARMHYTATLLQNGEVLLVGGWKSYDPITLLTAAELFDPSTNTFSPTASMSLPRAGQTATILADGEVIILAGCKSPLTSTPSGETYNALAADFAVSGSLNQKRCGHTATLLPNGKVLVTGGLDRYLGEDAPAITVLSSAELFDPQSSSSSVIGSMESPRSGHTATLLKDGRVLVVGGTDSTTAEIYP